MTIQEAESIIRENSGIIDQDRYIHISLASLTPSNYNLKKALSFLIEEHDYDLIDVCTCAFCAGDTSVGKEMTNSKRLK